MHTAGSEDNAARKPLCLLLVLICVLGAGLSTSSRADSEKPRLIVIGDSLSVHHDSWPSFLRNIAPRWNILVHAQNGRTIRDYDPPRDLWTSAVLPETVVYFLGTNDVLQNTKITSAKYRLRNHLSFLLERNFKVLLVNIPVITAGAGQFDALLEKHRTLIESFRGTHPNLQVFDLNNVWEPERCFDGVHPDATLSNQVAEAINWFLALSVY